MGPVKKRALLLGKLSVVNNHGRKAPVEFQERGYLLKAKGIVRKHRVLL